MGFELIFTAPQCTLTQWNHVINYFEDLGHFSVINRSTTGDEPTIAYAFGPIIRDSWPEDFLLAMKPPGVYLLFHTATRQQESLVITLLTKCLHKVGLTGIFEEL